jgi:hypothetical protein
MIAQTAAHPREQSDNLTAKAKELAHLAQEWLSSLGAEAAFEGGVRRLALLRFPCQAGLVACVSLSRHIAAQFA